MPIDRVVKLVSGLELDSETINTWKNGVERALKRYLPNETEAKGQKCPSAARRRWFTRRDVSSVGTAVPPNVNVLSLKTAVNTGKYR